MDASADEGPALELIERSLDRPGVCNRLDLLLGHTTLWESSVPRATERLERVGWRRRCRPTTAHSGTSGQAISPRSATVTIAPIEGARQAAELANDEPPAWRHRSSRASVVRVGARSVPRLRAVWVSERHARAFESERNVLRLAVAG